LPARPEVPIVTLAPWEYVFLPFSRTNFPDIYDLTWVASLVLTVAVILLYNVRTKALHRHPPYTEMWEWILWTSLITFFLVAIGALFLFDFFLVLGTLLIGLATLVWVRFRRFPPILRVYEQKLARERYYARNRPSHPEQTIRAKPARRTNRRRR
jgi:RsiW-degrading membrane proteinase PrsW (M82 family)